MNVLFCVSVAVQAVEAVIFAFYILVINDKLFPNADLAGNNHFG